MMKTLLLALRNLLRNRRRSLATLLAMALGSTATLLFGGFSTSIQHAMHTHLVQRGGQLQVQHRDFFLYGNGNPSAYGISDYEKLITAIREDEVLGPMVLVVTPSLQFTGIAGNYAAGVSRTIVGHGFVAEDINRMRRWNDLNSKIPITSSVLEGSPGDSAIVGTGLARVLQLCDSLQVAHCPKPQSNRQVVEGTPDSQIPPDIAQLSLSTKSTADETAQKNQARRIEILIGNARGAPNVTSLEVLQAEGQGVKELDEIYMTVHLSQIQRLIYGRNAPKVTALMVQLRHSSQIPLARARLQSLLAQSSQSQSLTVMDFRELNPFYVQTVAMFDTIFGFVFVLIGGIVLFTVSNTMNTAVVERTVEIGTLRAMGLRRSGIKKLFMVEGGVLGLTGAVLGVLLALLVSELVNHSGMTWLPPGDVEPLPLTITVWGENAMMMGTSFGLMLIAILSAWWPAHRAANLNVVDALRHV